MLNYICVEHRGHRPRRTGAAKRLKNEQGIDFELQHNDILPKQNSGSYSV